MIHYYCIHHLVEFAHSLGQTWSGTLMLCVFFYCDIKVSKRIQPAKSHFLQGIKNWPCSFQLVPLIDGFIYVQSPCFHGKNHQFFMIFCR